MVRSIRKFLSLVRFSHTIFALPFALAGFVFATQFYPFSWLTLLWVLLCMVTARSAAMGFNRIVDRDIDAENPRTREREIPRGEISVLAAGIFVAVNSILFVVFAFMLNPLCGWLSFPALGVLFFYSLSKRFLWGSQFLLGLSLAIAPVGAWLAVAGAFDWRIFLLAGAVLCWVAGFDIFYSSLDEEFDRGRGLFSIPVRWGVSRALWIARGLHVLTIVLLLSLYWAFGLGLIYLSGTVVVSLILIYEGTLVRANDLSKAMLAFNLNGLVSIFYVLVVFADTVIKMP
jgi:4-hydroxybenzoate polyprenyltransferase